ncbi:hypothetical protein Acr_29g0000360 [Actinidia rufa]|uniref:Uncharacterized protein n=1 Tax=Actinidia rufa TaxID=165716 RepID=A0A7J0HDT3_9ERIC|nr:hypothetical protein Acr_29g0000360 [Actinidia rufa]
MIAKRTNPPITSSSSSINLKMATSWLLILLRQKQPPDHFKTCPAFDLHFDRWIPVQGLRLQHPHRLRSAAANRE